MSKKGKFSIVNGAKTSSYKEYKKANSAYERRKNETEFPEFIEICKATQEELIESLPVKLETIGYKDVIVGDGYIYARGEVPVLLTAHMDTVHKDRIVDFYESVNNVGNHILTSPQGIGGDDRCGVYMILEIAKTHKCSILFCEDEEVGGHGSSKFVKTQFISELENMKYMIELDRANSADAVFYSCDNEEFTKFICENTGYKETYGSFSDISVLAPAAGVAAVNLSCGYYSSHQKTETVNVEEMLTTIEVVKDLLECNCEQFKYVKKVYSNNYYGRYGYNYGGYSYDYWDEGWYDDYCETHYNGYSNRNGYTYGGKYADDNDSNYDYGDGYNGYGQSKSSLVKRMNGDDDTKSYERKYKQLVLYVIYEDECGDENEVYITGENKLEAWYRFFMDYPSICFNDVLDFDYDYI